MLLRICAEIVLAISTYAVARQFWACGKREQYLKQVMSNEAHLESFISHAVLESPSPAMDYFAQPNQAGYGINLEAASAADKGATYRVRAFTCVALLAIGLASYFVGPVYAILNFVVFLIAWAGTLSEPARESALHHVLALAYICHKWRSKDPAQCERFFDQALALRPLYNVVKKVDS